ncbi:ATP-dependent helicase [Clostridium fungisolvens]|uniref:DNA 3'-5' helicase n=1 Tax=Clostridium fungisolvens TaxID=1604897 RepID=A0A6V8SE58_9CLOT|nr:ATP-dependent helicase [Clostridium fungisolvens]GFP74996.1 Putative ATP-dependent DNA helicase YjcD [Clostridium fungisolvens]
MANLDEFQEKAVRCNSRNTLVIAAPGSGKTMVIINRIKYLIEEKKVDPNNIVVITFTRAAALNMKERFMKLCNLRNYPFFGTFHGLFYKILKRHEKNVDLINPGDGYRLINKVLLGKLDEVGEEKVKEVLNNISIFKTSNTSMMEFESSISKDVFIECYEAYEEYKKQRNLMDFDDLQLRCIGLFMREPRILNGYRNLFKYILVDEFQDCDELQISLLKLLNGQNSVFAVGDEDQCIYTFRGSRPEYMVEFDKNFEQGEKFYLNYNYRSTSNIVDLSKSIIANNKNRNNKKIQYFRKESGRLEVVIPFNESEQIEDIISKVEASKNKGDRYKDNAVLYRTNMESRSIIDGLIRHKIPFKLLDKEYNFFHHFICKDILAYLKLSIDPWDMESFTRVINKPFRYISKGSLEKVSRSIVKESNFKKLMELEDIHPFQLKKLDELQRDISNLNKMTLSSAIDFILFELEYYSHLREYSDKFKQSISELDEIVEEFKEISREFKSIITLLAHVETVEENIKNSIRKSEEDAVILSTIHGVKGMEFKNVYVIDVNEEIIPHKNAEEDGEEERRLFYVGVTRAKDNLFIYSPKMLRGKFKGRSRFLEEIAIDKYIVREDYGFKPGDRVFHKSFGSGTVKGTTEDNIEITFDDGMVRGFSIKILVENMLISKIDKQ